MTVHSTCEDTDEAAVMGSMAAPRSDVWSALVSATATWSELSPKLFAVLEWDAFLRAAEYHGVLPIVAERLLESEAAREFQTELKDKFRHALQINLVRMLPLVEEVRRITGSFRAEGLDIIPYKGPVLSEEFWGSVAFRDCADLDFLVRGDDVKRAGELLGRMGYTRSVELPAHLRPALLKNASEEQFRHGETNLLLELQWAPAPHVFALGFDNDAIWLRKRTISFGGDAVLSPSPEDLLRLLCIHGWKHNWSRLIWLGDIVQLLLHCRMDWGRLFTEAKAERALRIVSLGLRMSHRVFGIQISAPFDFRDPQLDQLADELTQRMQDTRPCSYMEWHQYMLAARDLHRDQVRQVAAFLCTPGLGEYASCDLPAWAAGGYRAIRLGRVFRLIPGKTRE